MAIDIIMFYANVYRNLNLKLMMTIWSKLIVVGEEGLVI